MTGAAVDPSAYANAELAVGRTRIPGMIVVRQVLELDGRGWIKQSYDRDALVARGLAEDFVVAGERTSSVRHRGFTRGIHADTVSKYISLTDGEAFAAFVDLRQGEAFGRVETVHLTPSVGVFVPRGVGNSYQALTDGVQYTYLEEARRTSDPSTRLSLTDPELGIPWPIPIAEALLLPDDQEQPLLRDVVPVAP